MFVDNDENETSAKESETSRESLRRKVGRSSRKAKSSNRDERGREFEDPQQRLRSGHGSQGLPQPFFQVPLNPNIVPPGTSPPIETTPRWTWFQMPQGTSSTVGAASASAIPPSNLAGQWQFIPAQLNSNPPQVQAAEVNANEHMPVNKTSFAKDDSVKRKARRDSRRLADEESRNREAQGLKPYSVYVRPSGIIDSGCKGHLKWQEYVRDLTPRMLDLSVIDYKEQSEDSISKLWDALTNKFEFVENEVTRDSFDKMIKTWLRKDRERMKRAHISNPKPPKKLTDSQWENMKKYWNSDNMIQKSEKMSETRKKVNQNPKVGRRGYAGKEVVLVSATVFICFHNSTV